MVTGLSEMIAELRSVGGDCADIEAKSAAGGRLCVEEHDDSGSCSASCHPGPRAVPSPQPAFQHQRFAHTLEGAVEQGDDMAAAGSMRLVVSGVAVPAAIR
jgi:hypothetical protein